jgi:hypothetical protein
MMTPRYQWQCEVETACPKCGARPGKLCQTENQRDARRPHRIRVRAFKATHYKWEDPKRRPT